MGRETIRVALPLEPEADPAKVLRELEERLGRPLMRPTLVRGARVLALCLTAEELDLARQIRGVRDVREELPTEPPRPVRPRLEER